MSKASTHVSHNLRNTSLKHNDMITYFVGKQISLGFLYFNDLAHSISAAIFTAVG